MDTKQGWAQDRGDESNTLDTVDAYALLNFRGRYAVNDNSEIFSKPNNVCDTNYETFGLLGEDPSELDAPLFENFSNPRFIGPGAPISGFVGMKLSM